MSETKINLAETEAASMHLTIEDFTSDSNELYREKENWLDGVIAAKLKAEHDEALSLRTSIIADFEKIKTQVMSLLKFDSYLGLIKYDVSFAIDTRASRYE